MQTNVVNMCKYTPYSIQNEEKAKSKQKQEKHLVHRYEDGRGRQRYTGNKRLKQSQPSPELHQNVCVWVCVHLLIK